MLKKILLTLILLFIPFQAFADEFVRDIIPVTVDSFINIDNTSTVDVNPTIVEVGIESDVLIRILDRNNNPIENREVEIYVVGNPSSITITQPGSNTDSDGYAVAKVKSSSPGTFTVKAVDKSYAQGDIDIVDSATITVFPIPTPVLNSEPYYTKGTDNRIFWVSLSGLSSYQYYVESSTKADFSVIAANSGWVNTVSHEFTNLSPSTLYYYRLRAKNIGGEISSWSTSVFSTQDSKAPVVKYVDIQRINTGKVFSGISIKFDVSDDYEIGSVAFFCKRENGSLDGCGTVESSGARYYVSVSISDLEKGGFGSFLEKYSFCVNAKDKAGNETSNCDFEIEVSEFVQTPIPALTNVVNYIINYLNDSLNDIGDNFSDAFNASHEFALSLFSILIYVLVLIVSLAVLAQGVFVIPSFILFNTLRFFKVLGFKKHASKLGFVYNAVTGKPVKFAKVVMYDADNKKLFTTVTNLKGEFFGVLDTGKYRLNIVHPHYLYPSQMYKERTVVTDGKLYRGEYIIATNRNPMNLSIPIDPENIYTSFEKDFKLEKKMINFLKALTFLLIAVGLAVSFFTFEKYQNLITLILLLMYIPAVGIFLKSVIKLK